MVECQNPELEDNTINMMERYNIKPNQINLEITESFDSFNNENAHNNILKLLLPMLDL